MSWLKSVGLAIAGAAKAVVHFLGSSQVQNAEQQAANIAELLLPAEAPLIQGFQTIMGKIFKQAVVAETTAAGVTGSGQQKADQVYAAISADLDQYVANNFPGSATVDKLVKAGLIKAVADFQNAIVAAAPPPAA